MTSTTLPDMTESETQNLGAKIRDSDDWHLQSKKYFWFAFLFGTAALVILSVDLAYYYFMFISLLGSQSGGWLMALILSLISLAIVICIDLALHRNSSAGFAIWLYKASLPLGLILAFSLGGIASVIGLESFVKAMTDPSQSQSIVGAAFGSTPAPIAAPVNWTDKIPGILLSGSLATMALLMPIVFALAAGPLARTAITSLSAWRHWRAAVRWLRDLIQAYEAAFHEYFSFMRYKNGFVANKLTAAKVRIHERIALHKATFIEPLQSQLDEIEKRPAPAPWSPNLPRNEPDLEWLRSQIIKHMSAIPTEEEIDDYLNEVLKPYLESIVR